MTKPALCELPKEARAEAVASIRRWFDENLQEPIGELQAGLLLDFFVKEIGPLVYNRAIADAQERMQLHVTDLTSELFQDAFRYWIEASAPKRR